MYLAAYCSVRCHANYGVNKLPKDVLDIVDTAVKIGLGALISSITTYWVTKLNLKKTADKEKAEKHRQMIEEVAENIERLFALLFSFRAGIHDWVSARNKGVELPKERYESILSTQRSIPSAYKEITSSEAKLLLINAKAAQLLVRKFGHDISDCRKHVFIGNKELKLEEVEAFRDTLLKNREDIFLELSKAFDK
jgi:hypothetical protein